MEVIVGKERVRDEVVLGNHHERVWACDTWFLPSWWLIRVKENITIYKEKFHGGCIYTMVSFFKKRESRWWGWTCHSNSSVIDLSLCSFDPREDDNVANSMVVRSLHEEKLLKHRTLCVYIHKYLCKKIFYSWSWRWIDVLEVILKIELLIYIYTHIHRWTMYRWICVKIIISSFRHVALLNRVRGFLGIYAYMYIYMHGYLQDDWRWRGEWKWM